MDPSASELARAQTRAVEEVGKHETTADDAPETDPTEEDFLGEAEQEAVLTEEDFQDAAALTEEDFLDEAEQEIPDNLEDRRRCRQAYWGRISGS